MNRPAILDQDVVVVQREPIAWTQQSVLDRIADGSDHGGCEMWAKRDIEELRDFLEDDTIPDDIPLYASPHAGAWEEVRAYVVELERHITLLQEKSAAEDCACSYDRPDDVCLGHSPMLKAAEVRIAELEARLKEAERVLTGTRAIVSEAAMTGFNYADGNWPERLFANQAAISSTIRNISAFMEGGK